MGGGDRGGSGRAGEVASGGRRRADRTGAGTDTGEVTEHAVRMTDGSMCVRSQHPDIERIYPLAMWIRGQIEVNRTHVYRRRVVVVDDWVEVVP